MLCRFIKNQTITCRKVMYSIPSAGMRAIRGDEWKTVQEWCVIIQILFSFSDVWQGTVLTMDSNYISDSWKMCCQHWFKPHKLMLGISHERLDSDRAESQTQQQLAWGGGLHPSLTFTLGFPTPPLFWGHCAQPLLPGVQSHLLPVFFLSWLTWCYLYTQGTYALSSAIQVFNDQSDIKSLILAIWVLCSITLCYFSF